MFSPTPQEPRPTRSSPSRMSHDLYFRMSEPAPHNTSETLPAPYQPFSGTHRRNTATDKSAAAFSGGAIGAQFVGDTDGLWAGAPSLRQGQHASTAQGQHTASSYLFMPSDHSDPNSGVNSSGEEPRPSIARPHTHAIPAAAVASGAGVAVDEVNRALSELKVENRNLRMRLVFMDELMAKRNISSTVMNDLVDARQEIDLLKKHLTEGTRQYDLQQEEVRQLRMELQNLSDQRATLVDQNKLLREIPQLQHDVRKAEMERDDAVTKLLTLQLDVNSERQALNATITELQSTLERVATERAATVAMKEDVIVAERLAFEERLQSVTSASDEAKSDLRAMLEQRSEALHNSEREADRFRADASSLEADVAGLRRAATEYLDTIDALQRQVQERDLELRRHEMRIHDSQYEEEKRTVALHTQLQEAEKTLASSEDMLLVYKRALQYSLDLLRGGSIIQTPHGAGSEVSSAPASPAHSPSRSSTSGVPFILSPMVASRLPQPQQQSSGEAPTSPIRSNHRAFDDAASPHVVTSTGAVVMASVLKNAIDDSARSGLQEQQRQFQHIQGIFQRQLASFASDSESLHAQQLTKLRRLSNRIADASDVAELCSRRQTKFHLRVRGDVGVLVAAKEALEAEVKLSRQHLSAAAEEHLALHAELRRTTGEREVERQVLSNVQLFLDQLGGTLQSDVRRAAEETRQSVVQVRLINPEFLESVRGITKKAHATVLQVHDLVDVAQRQYHQLIVTGGQVSPSHQFLGNAAPSPSHYSLHGRSPSMSSGVHRTGDAPKPALTLENLIQQLVNVCQLLENNIQQGQQSEDRLKECLQKWEVSLTREWHEVERRLVSILQPMRHPASQAAALPHTALAAAYEAPHHASSHHYRQPLHQQFMVHRSTSQQHVTADDHHQHAAASAFSKEPSPAPVPTGLVPTPLTSAYVRSVSYVDPALNNSRQPPPSLMTPSQPSWMQYASTIGGR